MAACGRVTPVTTSKGWQPGEDSDLGTATAEAARLLEALRRWANERGFAAPSAGNVATGSAECKLCPFCQAISTLRDNHPDVIEHLGVAAESLLAAARSVISEPEVRRSQSEPRHVQHIDINE